MKTLRRIWHRLVGAFISNRRRDDTDLSTEFESHIAMLAEKNVGRGMSPDEARREAILTFGAVEPAKENYRDQRGLPGLDSLRQDVRYALRGMRRSPGFTAVVVICLALGIGANTAIFTVINCVLLRPLPFKDPSRLVSIISTRNLFSAQDVAQPPLAAYFEIKAQTAVFSDTTTFQYNQVDMTGAAEPEWLTTLAVPADFFPMLGIPPMRGRTFAAGEEQPGRDLVAVLSYHVWQRQFGGDDAAIGKTIFLDAKPYTVVGVMPALFNFPQGAQIWIPLHVAGIPIDDPVKQYVSVAARLQKGVSLQQAQTVLQEIATRLSNTEPAKYKGHGLWAESIAKSRVSWVRDALWLLFGAVGFVLLIACANVGNLFLARGWQRQKEFSVRAALGATRVRIVRQLLVESVVIALFGGTLGFAFAIASVGVLRSIAPPEIPRIDQLHVDGNVFLFTLAVSILAGILFGLIPASQISNRNLSSALKDEKPQLAGIRAKLRILHVRDVLTTCEVALCLVLLIGSTLAMRSFLNLLDVNPGFRTDHLLSMRIAPPQNKYPKKDQITAVVMQMIEKVRTVPGVAAASVKIDPFMDGFDLGENFRVISSDGTQTEQDLQSRFVASDFFKTLRIPVLQGRVFDQRDDQVNAPVAIVNESLAKRFFPGKSPIGEHIVEEGFRGQPDTLREIVGEVSDVRDRDVGIAPAPTIYTPYLQSHFGADLAFLLVRTAVTPAALTKSIEEQIWSVDKDTPIEEVETIDQKISDLVVEPKFRALLLSAFAGLGLTLALVGIFGVVSYSVSQRTREIGIRIAIGAQRRNVLVLVLAGGMLPVIIGIAIGTAGALALTRLIQSFLYEIKPTDPLSYFAVALVFCAIALLACYQPARRATRVDPVVALRHE